MEFFEYHSARAHFDQNRLIDNKGLGDNSAGLPPNVTDIPKSVQRIRDQDACVLRLDTYDPRGSIVQRLGPTGSKIPQLQLRQTRHRSQHMLQAQATDRPRCADVTTGHHLSIKQPGKQ